MDITIRQAIRFLFVSGLVTANTLAYSGAMLDTYSLSRWEGFYTGVYLGGGWDHTRLVTDAGMVSGIPIPSYFTSVADINSVNLAGSGKITPSSFAGGVYAGNNVLVNRYLVGLVVDLGYLGLEHSLNSGAVSLPSIPAINYTLTTSMKTNWLFTTRANFGYIYHDWLYPYITGGVAVTNLSVSNSYQETSQPGTVFTSSNGINRAGWTIGGGIQVPIKKNLFLNAEYLYVEFPSLGTTSIVNCSNSLCSSQLTTSYDLNLNLLKLGLNYRFIG